MTASKIFHAKRNRFADGDHLRTVLDADGETHVPTAVLYDASGNPITPDNPLYTADMKLAVSAGLVPGQYPINKYGSTSFADTNVLTDVWDVDQPVWLPPTAPRIHTLYSTSDEDSGPGGTVAQGDGAQEVRVWYLPDWDTKEATEDVVMDGTSGSGGGVAMLNEAVIIHRMKVVPSLPTQAPIPNVGSITAVAAAALGETTGSPT